MSEDTRRTHVKIIQRIGAAALVQYQIGGTPTRAFIPSSELGDGFVLDTVLSQAPEYGYPWQDCNLSIDPQKFADEMHAAGIWTADDALKSPKQLWTALNATLAPVISEILTMARQEYKRSL